MAMSKQLHIDAIQTAIPSRVIAPGKTRRIDLSSNMTNMTQKLLQSRFRVIFYYNNNNGGGGEGEQECYSAWMIAAWAKESLSVALADWPELAGRLRKGREGEEGSSWEIKINDAGVRLLQASVEMTMDEFLAAEDRGEKEEALADWVEIGADSPDFSALFYIQVTQFEGNGYAIGITFSLLLNDPLFLAQFLKSWAKTHAQMLAHGRLSKKPIFHLGYFQRPTRPIRLRSVPLDSFRSANAKTTETVLFKAEKSHGYRKIASSCVKGASRFALIVNKDDKLEIESCDVGDEEVKEFGEVKLAKWEDLGLEDFTLTKGNRPVSVSYRFVSPEINDEALVVVMQSNCEEEVFIGTTIPKN